MYRQILFPTEQNLTIVLPEEYYGLEIEVIAFPLSEKKISITDADAFYDGIGLDFSGYKFNREEAKER